MYKPTTPFIINNIAAQLKIFIRAIYTSTEVGIDLSELPDIDSAGLAMLLELKQIANRRKCNLVISAIHPSVLHLCNLYKITL